MKKTVLRYGFYASAVIIVLFLVTWLTLNQSSANYELQEIIGYLGIVLSLSFVFFGMRYYREQVNGGTLTFGEGLKTGLLIVLIPSFAFGLFDVIYVSLVDPEFLNNYSTYQLEKLKASVPAASYEIEAAKLQDEMKMFSNPAIQFVAMFLTVFMIGVIITVISAVVLRKNTSISAA